MPNACATIRRATSERGTSLPCQFSYRAGSRTKPRRVIAKVEWHPGELYPRVGFIVTNLSRPVDRVVASYNKRGTCEQWIKEGKGAISGRGYRARRSLPTRFAFNFMRCPTISAISCARWATPRTDQGLVAD